MKFDERNPNFFKSPSFVSMATAAKFVQPIPIFLIYLVPLDVDVVPIKFDQFLFSKQPAMIIFVFFIFLAFWPFPWQRQPFWKNQPLKGTTFHKV
jgi:hypothetical protein